MQHDTLAPLLPDLQCIASCFPGSQIFGDVHKVFSGIRSYRSGLTLDSHTLYYLSEAGDFPRDDYAWISAEAFSGRAAHIICPNRTATEIFDAILSLLEQFHDWEFQLDALCFRNAKLDRLCDLAAQMTENPVCMHDPWFMLIGRSTQVDEVLPTESVMESSRDFLPRTMIDEFSNDHDYLETYSHHEPMFWKSYKGAPNSLYANLWDGDRYLGRIVVMECLRPVCHQDFLLMNAIAVRADYLLKRKQQTHHRKGKTMDDTMYAFLNGEPANDTDAGHLLSMLNWKPEDSLLSIRLQSQNAGMNDLEERMLHSDLFRAFPDSYILFSESQQVVILNLSKTNLSLSMVHYILSPLCRDYCLYTGVSSPVTGIAELPIAYLESGVALEKAFQLHNEKWILFFEHCSLEYLLDHMEGPLKPQHLVSPKLRILQNYDAEKGTPYYETLREYLLSERDIPKTSEKLIVHRTTLLYRLKKIQSILSIDFEDPWERMNLMLSIWVLENR